MAELAPRRPGAGSSGDLLADRRYAYAIATARDGDHHASADLLEQVIERVPDWAPAWFALGEARAAFDDDDGAAAAFRHAQALDPDDVLGAGPRLARLGGGAEALPTAYVRALFEGYAPRFEAHLVGDLAYRGPALLRDAVRAARPGARFAAALDLGCGTGLMGAAIRSHASRLAGADLSAAMIERARARGVYDHLVVADLGAFLAGEPEGSADLVLAADVLVYLGDLAPLVAGVARVLAPGGLFAFTVQARRGDGYALGADLRFAHSDAYLHERAGAAGFRLRLSEAWARREHGAPVPGRVGLMDRA